MQIYMVISEHQLERVVSQGTLCPPSIDNVNTLGEVYGAVYGLVETFA